MKRITGRLTEKNGKWYAVINLYTEEGKRKEKWHSLDLEAKRGTKTEANHRLNEVLAKFNTGELYLKACLSKAEQEKRRQSEQSVGDYMSEWLEGYKCNLSVTTYNTYKLMLDSRITPYFQEIGVALRDLTGDEINDFYIDLRNDGLSGATAQRYHSLLHLSFKNAVKRRILVANPCNQADRPKSVQYIGSYYNSKELKELMDCLDGDPMRVTIILTAYYGLRRSEVLGLKWDAIDFAENKIYIRHKIIANKMNNSQIEGYDVMKTNSSYRSLPLLPHIKDILLEEKSKQENMQRMLRGSYNRKYIEYVCVDAVGDILKPQYVTQHFKRILEKNGLKIIRFHDLRHSCASLLLANKVPMKMIQDWLGHSDMSTTANIYSHVDSTSKQETAEVIGIALSLSE